MEEITGQGIQELCDSSLERAKNATDPKERSEAISDYVKLTELKLKYESLVDSHDENVEKILNAEMDDEKRREDDIKRENRKFKLEIKKVIIDLSFGIVKMGLLFGILVWSIRFDKNGVLFTSNAGKQMTSQGLKKFWDFLKF